MPGLSGVSGWPIILSSLTRQTGLIAGLSGCGSEGWAGLGTFESCWEQEMFMYGHLAKSEVTHDK